MTFRAITSWEAVERYIATHSLPYRVIRFNNMSRAGVLVSTWNGETMANTVKEARRFFRAL